MRNNGQPTINDVARLAGVSKKTVSRVINHSPLLNEDTRRRVEEVIGSLGYIPNPQARALALRRNFLIGVVHDNTSAQTLLDVQQGMLDGLHGTEFAMVSRPLDPGSPTMLDDFKHFLERQRPFGVLLIPPICELDAVARMCRDFGCLYVRMGSAMLDDPQHMVLSNDREAVFAATSFLIEQGHRRIAMIAGPNAYRSAQERRTGFEEALAAADIPLPRGLIAEGDYSFASGLTAAAQLLDTAPRPTAIFASNDEMAAGAMHAALQRGLTIPRDLSIIGFDDTPVAAHVWPPLTTVRRPVVAMARSAALKLIAGAEGEEAPDQPAVFPSTLIRRASVAPPPA